MDLGVVITAGGRAQCRAGAWSREDELIHEAKIYHALGGRGPILTGETCGFPRNAPFPAAGISARKPVTDPARAAFFRGGWFAPPWVFGGVLTGAADGLEGRKRRRERWMRLPSRFRWARLALTPAQFFDSGPANFPLEKSGGAWPNRRKHSSEITRRKHLINNDLRSPCEVIFVTKTT